MKYFIFPLLISTVLLGCKENENAVPGTPVATTKTAENKKFIQVTRRIDNSIPSIGISNYTLITDDLGRDTADADAILLAKVIIPLAMQKHDVALFDSILAKDFTAQGEGEFFEREAFIQNRVNGKWMISDVQYENLVLQFFRDIALLTYRNTVKEKDEKGMPLTWHYTWADIWIKEDRRWKIKVSRGIH
jgi:ketosteroid isomerase-like protein